MTKLKTLQNSAKKVQVVPVEKTVNSAVISENATETKPTEEEAKQEVKALLEKYKPEPPKSAEDRIERSKQFEALSTRFRQLKDKSNELQTFKAGNDKLNAKVVFKNTQGFEFSVQNSNVIAKLLEAGEKELSILLAEADNEVMTFEI